MSVVSPPVLAAFAAAVLGGSLLLPVSSSAQEPEYSCDGRTATIVGTAEDDEITGTDGDDVIVGLAGQDIIDAGPGDDVVCGGDNADVLRGGPGADRLFGELEDTEPEGDVPLGGDSLLGGPGDDYLDPGHDPSGRPNRDQLRWGDSPRRVRLDLADGITGTSTGHGKDTMVLTGSPLLVTTKYADTVAGSPRGDRIKAGRGADTVYAGPGNDEIWVDADRRDPVASDLVQAGPGDDTVWNHTGPDRVFLGKGRDHFSAGGAQNVRVRGQRGNDYIDVPLASGGGFLARGDQGIDSVGVSVHPRSGSEARRLTIDVSASSARFGNGPRGVLADFEDHTLSGVGTWYFRGGPRNDEVNLLGLYGARLIARTFAGNDRIEGGVKGDVIDAGTGWDWVYGDKGYDRCLNAEKRRSCEVVR